MEIAVLPVAETVAMPGQTHKLVISDRRYQMMVDDCLDKDISLGITLATGEYPHDHREVMGMGVPKLIGFEKDGSYEVQVDIVHKVHVVEVVQYLPYCLADVCIVKDHFGEASHAEDLADEILEFAGIVLRREISLADQIKGDARARLRALVLWVFSWFDMAPDVKQEILEIDDETLRGFFLAEQLLEYIHVKGLDEELDVGVISPVKRRKGNLIEVDFEGR